MYISDRFVFLEMQKTGCTHIGALLADLIPGQQLGKHNRFAPGALDTGKSYIASIRNPWDWYLSLWAFGCDGQGAIFLLATRPQLQYQQVLPYQAGYAASMVQHQQYSRHAGMWMDTYRDVNNPENFRQWLRMLHDREYMDDVGEHFGTSPLAGSVGLMTFRYVSLLWRDTPGGPITPPMLANVDADQCYVTHFIRNEHLEVDFAAALDACGHPLSDAQREHLHQRGRTNTSTARDASLAYYDAEAIELVAQRDRLIIEKFGYEPPVS